MLELISLKKQQIKLFLINTYINLFIYLINNNL
jgi:hypothetical protein